jgi:hypothetical protein
VEEGDDGEGDGEREGVQHRLGDAPLEGDFQQVRDGGFAQPAERERGERDAELGGGNVGVQVVNQAQEPLGSLVARARQRRNAGAAHTDQRKFGRDEKAVSEDEEEDKKDVKGGDHVA